MRAPRRLAAVFSACVAACSMRGAALSDAGPPSYDYTPCVAEASCETGATCNVIAWSGGTGGLCTALCAYETECPHDGRCLDVTGAGSYYCFEPCVMDGDCPTAFLCQPISTGGSVCLPG